MSGIVSFNLYTSFRLMINFLSEELKSLQSDKFYALFKVCIPSWIDCIQAKAQEQVQKVLAQEKERNSWANIEEVDQVDGRWIKC